MAYENNNQQNIHSLGINIYSATTQLQIDLWNNFFSIKLTPAFPDDNPSDTRKFDWKRRLQTAIPIHLGAILGKGILEVIEAARKGEAKSVGIQAARVNLVYISNGIAETGEVNPYISLHMDIDSNKIPQQSLTYPFAKTRIFSKFDATTGEYEATDDSLAILEAVGNYLISGINALGAAGHGFKMGDPRMWNAQAELIRQQATAAGIPYGTPNQASRSAQRDPWNGGSSASPTSAPMPTQAAITSASMDDIAALMNRVTVEGMTKAMIESGIITKKQSKMLRVILG